MKDKARKPTTTPGSEPPPAEGSDLPERWSVQRKTELVLRLLRGEVLDAVSCESQVPAQAGLAWLSTQDLDANRLPAQRALEFLNPGGGFTPNIWIRPNVRPEIVSPVLKRRVSLIA